MRHAFAALLLLSTSSIAFAGCPAIGDWDTHVGCAAKPYLGGGASVRGYDAGWHSYSATDIDPRGNMYGYDPRGNYWRYDARTGVTTYFDSTPSWNLFTSRAGWE